MPSPRLRPRAAGVPDAGFTLVEVVVAMGIAGLTLMALLGATLSGARASMDARVNQQAADLLTKTIEDLRSLDFGAIAMADADVGNVEDAIPGGQDGCPVTETCWAVPNVGSSAAPSPSASSTEAQPSASSGSSLPRNSAVEPLVTAPTGAVTPHETTVTANANNVTFTLRRYITSPADGNTVRATAVVEWQLAGAPHSRTFSTVIANTRRGLPLPKFAVTASGAVNFAINPGSQAQLPFIIKNLGARDAFDLRVYTSDTPQTGWVFYPDATCAGGLDPDNMPAPLAMHSGDYLTPELYPDSVNCFIAAKTLDTEGTYAFTIRAQSTKQPSATGAVITSKPITVNVQSGVVAPTSTPTPTPSGSGTPSPSPSATESASPTPTPSTTTVCASPGALPTPPNTYTLRRFVLLNSPQGDTATAALNPMQRDDCTVQSTSHAYSTNVSSATGRSVATGGSTSTGGGANVAEWRWLAPVITEFSGDATLLVYYQCASGTASLQVALGDWNQTKSADTAYTSRVTTTANVSCDGTWRTAEIDFTVSKFSLRSKTNSSAVPTYLVLRVAAPSGTSVRLNYDSASAPSTLFIGSKP